MLAEIIATLTTSERIALFNRAETSGTQVSRLLLALLSDPSLSEQELISSHGISKASYFKNLTLAKDEIYEVIKMHMRNSYDDLLLANQLYRRGLETDASKLRLKLEEEYEHHGWWNVLQELHNMEMMVAYAKCDLKWMEKNKSKIFANQERINRFVYLDKEIIVQMAIIEGGGLKEKNYNPLESKLNALLKEARALGHHIPIFNATHSLFTFYTRYAINFAKADALIASLPGFLKEFDKQLIPYTKAAAWLNTVTFLTDFDAGRSPEPYFKHVERSIGIHGQLYDAQAILNFCQYHFMQRNIQQFEKCFERYMKLPAEKSLHFKVEYLHCLKAYMKNDAKTFSKHKNRFYTDIKNRAYNDCDLTIRKLEILMLIESGEILLAADKLEATTKFTRRHFPNSRIELEKQNWKLFGKGLNSKAVKPLKSGVLNINNFIANEMLAHF